MYFITGLTKLLSSNDQLEEYKDYYTRCFGYYKEFKYAERAVINNAFDMWETMYDYIVIEGVEEGVHPVSIAKGWYKYNQEKNEYEQIEVGHTGFCNYALG